jgi:WD40 repeat protein
VLNYRVIPVLLCTVTAAFLSDRPGALHAQVDSTLSCQDNPAQDYQTITITRNDQFAIATHYNRLTAWELASGKQVYSLNKEIRDVVYSQTANRVLFTDGEGTELLELVIGASPAEWSVRTILSGFQDHQTLAVSSDGRYMALRIEYDDFGILDLTTKKLVFRNKLEEIQQAAFAPDGNVVALTFDRAENAVVTYSIPDGQQVASSASFLSSAKRLAYSPDGKALAVTCVMGGANSLVVLDAEHLRPIRGAQFPIYVSARDCAVGWSGDGVYLAASGVENTKSTIGVYDVQNTNRLVLLRGYWADS